MAQAMFREQVLRDILEVIVPEGYDYLLIDCNPSMGILLTNALVADRVLIPVQTEEFSVDGLEDMMELIQMVNGEAVVTPLTASARNTALETAEGGGKSFVQNLNITSPKALSPYETARQTRNATRNMVLQLQGG